MRVQFVEHVIFRRGKAGEGSPALEGGTRVQQSARDRTSSAQQLTLNNPCRPLRNPSFIVDFSYSCPFDSPLLGGNIPI